MKLDFEVLDENGDIKNRDYLLGEWSVMFFYPIGGSRGVIIKAQDFSFLYDKFKKSNCKIIGVSQNKLNVNKEFIKKYDLRVSLFSDIKCSLIRQMDMLIVKKISAYTIGVFMYTYIVDPDCNIVKVYKNPKATRHASIVYDDLLKLQKDYKS